jgi:uncharacterized alpha-E superfamily protein
VLLSSLAECVYWFGRYIERAENTARMVMVNDSLLLDVPSHCDPGWDQIIQITGNHSLFFKHYDTADERSVIRFLLMDRDSNPGSLTNSITMARDNMRYARALFPKQVWEVVGDLHSYAQANHAGALTGKERYKFLRRVIDACHLLHGKLALTSSHDEIYEFTCMGFNLERADMTSRVINIGAKNLMQHNTENLPPFADIQWKSVLDSLAAWQMYRRRVHNGINGPDVMRFLLKDQHFPRAIDHCLLQLEQSLYTLAVKDTPRNALRDTRKRLRNLNVERLSGEDLHLLIDELQLGFNAIHEELSRHYFEGREPAPNTSAIPSLSVVVA